MTRYETSTTYQILYVELIISHAFKHTSSLAHIHNQSNIHFFNDKTRVDHLFGNSSSGSLALKDLLDDLLFFNEESTDDAVTDTTSTTRTTVGTADGLGILAHSVVFSGAQSGNLKSKKKMVINIYAHNNNSNFLLH